MQTSLRNLNHNLQQLNKFCSKIIAWGSCTHSM
jgi:hypothetical protein